MSSSVFSLCPLGGPGESGFSYRFFECMHVNTIPVLIVDRVSFPYSDLDWNSICVRIPEAKVNNIQYIKDTLDGVEVEEMLSNIKKVRKRFTLGGVQEEVYKELND